MIDLPIVKIALKLTIFLLVTAVALAIPYFWLPIEPEQQYGFFSSLLHGFFRGPNLALGLLDGRLTSAAQHTGWPYHAGFATGIVLAAAVWYLVNGVLQGVFMVIDER